MPTKTIINCTTHEVTEVELTEEELIQLNQDSANLENQRIAREAQAEARAVAKASALVKLNALGLTEDEVKAIAG
jgi:hypothetical protein